MYLAHFGLDQPPFRITPDTRVFYPGGNRGAVLDALAWAVESGEGLIKVVGEVGSGKTMLGRMLAARLPEHIEVVYVVDPGLGPEDIIPAIAFELGLEADAADHLATRHRLYEALVERHAAGRQVVVFIEEAQNMPLQTLEALRLLSNLETDDSKLLQLVLFGQPELDTNLDANEIRQLRERITHSFYLDPLAWRDVAQYLNFRLRAVGYRGPDLFDTHTARAINRRARGLIRRINLLADKTLLAAYAEGTHSVRRRHVRRAAEDAGLAPRARFGRMAIAVSVLLVVGAVAWMVLGWVGLHDLVPGFGGTRGAGLPEFSAGETAS